MGATAYGTNLRTVTETWVSQKLPTSWQGVQLMDRYLGLHYSLSDIGYKVSMLSRVVLEDAHESWQSLKRKLQKPQNLQRHGTRHLSLSIPTATSHLLEVRKPYLAPGPQSTSTE